MELVVTVAVSDGEAEDIVTFQYGKATLALAKVEALMALSRRINDELVTQAALLMPGFAEVLNE
jgi:hypothetical protein